jgi:hypothetical protein
MPHIEARDISLIYDTPSGTVPGDSGVSFSTEARNSSASMAPDVFATALSRVEVNPGFPDLKAYMQKRAETLVQAKTIMPFRTGAKRCGQTLWKRPRPEVDVASSRDLCKSPAVVMTGLVPAIKRV